MSDQKKIEKSEEEWRQQLTPEQYRVLREADTETPFSGEYYHIDEDGVYHCAACNNELFKSETKYDSGSGWPSFFKPITPDAVEYRSDNSAGMQRTEIICGRCGSHLGHVFDDGPVDKGGQRFCINSLALNLEEESSSKEDEAQSEP